MQLAQLANKLEQVAKNETLVIAGDLNLDWANSEDQAILAAFSERLGLILAEKGGRPKKIGGLWIMFNIAAAKTRTSLF